MLLLKSFIRKKSTKIYGIVFVIIFIVIGLIINFNKYYDFLLNEKLSECSRLYVVSKKDCSEDLKEFKNIVEVKKTIVFEENPSSENIGRRNNVITKDGVTTYIEGDNSSELKWDDLMALDTNILAERDETNKLIGNQIKININTGLQFREEKIRELKGAEIKLNFNNEEYTFTIQDFNYSFSSGIVISNELYNKLLQEEPTFGYIIKDKEYDELDLIIKKLEKKYGKDSIDISESQSYIGEESDEVMVYREIIETLGWFTFAIVTIFFIVGLICLRNIGSDENQNINFQFIIGFKTRQVFLQQFLNKVLLCATTIIIAIIIQIPIVYFINNVYKLGLTYFNVSEWIKEFLIILIMIIVSIRVKRNSNVKIV